MKVSARNVIEGKVVAVTKGVTTAHVKIEVASGFVITASITNESVDDLGISVGKPVMAIIKSSDVIVGVPLECEKSIGSMERVPFRRRMAHGARFA